MVLKVKTEAVGLNQSIDRIVGRVNRRGLKIKIRAQDFSQPLGRITQQADEFTKSLEASNARVIAFGASAAIIGTVAKTFEQLVVQAVRVEKLLTDINVVLGTSQSNLAKFGKDLFDVARNTSQALDVAAEAALEFSRQGLSMEETLRRTNDALILTRLTGIDAAAAVSGLTAAVNGFADAGLTTTSIINKLAAVDVKFAVSADDLINALARSGAVAQDAGVSFDQLVGAVTSAQQITARGGAVIGNSFKTIFTRVQRSSTLDRLEELGVAVRDIRGNTLPALSILESLAKTYDTLGSSTKAAVAEQVGGVFQINVLKAALKDLNRENSLYAQATDISANATDQAQQKNAQLQQTISSLAKQTSLSIQELSSNIGELALAPGISNILEALNDVAGFLNNSLGKDAEGVGSDIAKGLVRGLGNVITGPGVVLAFGIFAKLFANAFKFAKDSLKDVLGIVTAKDKERKIQESIVMAMQNNKALAQELGKFAGDKLKQEELIFAVIQRQTENMQRQANLAKSLAPGLIKRGVNPNLTLSPPGKGAATGFVPNFSSSVSPSEKSQEQKEARKSGYAPGDVSDMNIKGVGRVIYNKAETIKSFPGMEQPAIMPPKNSRAGKKYEEKFSEKHQFSPYAFGGFIPNFVDPRTRGQKIKDTLNDPANKGIKFNSPMLSKGMDFKLKSLSDRQFIETYFKQKTGDGNLYLDRLRKINGYSEADIKKLSKLRTDYQSGSPVSLNGERVLASGFVPNFYDPIKDTKLSGTVLNLPLAKMMTETNVQSGFGIKAKKMTGTYKLESPINNILPHAKTWSDELKALQKSGVTVISRMMQFSNYDNKNKAARNTANFQRRNPRASNTAVGNKYEQGLYKNSLKDAGYSPTVAQGKVDFIKPGSKPIESKFNKIESGNLIAKSIKIYKDRSITNYLKKIGLKGEASSFKKKNLEDSLGMLKSSGVDTSGNLKDQIRLVRNYDLSQGFVPNFMSKIAGSNNLRKPTKKNLELYTKNLNNFLKEKSKNKIDKWTARDFRDFLKNQNITKSDSQLSYDIMGAPHNTTNQPTILNQELEKNPKSKKLIDQYKRGLQQEHRHVSTGSKYEDALMKEFSSVGLTKETGNSPPIDFIRGITEIPALFRANTKHNGKKLGPEFTLLNSSKNKPLEAAATIGHEKSHMGNKGLRFASKHHMKKLIATTKRAINSGKKTDGASFLENSFVELSQSGSEEKNIQGISNRPLFQVVSSPGSKKRGSTNSKQQKPTATGRPAGKNKLVPNPKGQKSATKENKANSFNIEMFGGYGAQPSKTYSAQVQSIEENIEGHINRLKNPDVAKITQAGLTTVKSLYNKDQLNLSSHPKNLSSGFIPNFGPNLFTKRSFAYRPQGGKDWYTQLGGKAKHMSEFVKWLETGKKLPPVQIKKLKSQFTKDKDSYEKSYWDDYNSISSGGGSRAASRNFYGTNATSPRPLPGDEMSRLNITNPDTKLFIKKDKMESLVNEWKSDPSVRYNPLYRNQGFVPNFVSGAGIKKTPFRKFSRQAALSNQSRKAINSFFDSNKGLPNIPVSKDGSLKLTQRNFESARQFLNSSQFRQLSGQNQTKILESLQSQASKQGLGQLSITRKWGQGQTNKEAVLGGLGNSTNNYRLSGSGYALGLIPNFSNPLTEAIGRERAAGIPSSMIEVDQDDSLKTQRNPMGLAVTNTRDEPLGVRQGIKRAKEMGVDPKTHGASSGLIPNFVGGAKNTGFGSGANSVNLGGGSNKTASNISSEAKGAAKGLNALNDSSGNLMMGLFALTSVSYMLEGAIGEAEGGMAAFAKGANAALMGLAQGTMAYQGLNMAGQGMIDSGGAGSKKAKLGSFVKGLGAVAGIAGLLVPVFSALKENTTWLDSGLDTLNKSAKKTAKNIEAVGSAMEATTSVQETQKQITDLTNSGQANTYQGQMKLMSLNSTLIKNQNALQQSSLSLAKELNLSGDELQAMTSGTAQGMEKLQEAMTKLTIRQSVTAAATSMERKDSLGFVSKDLGTLGDSRFKAELGIGGVKYKRKSNEEIYEENFDRKDRINFRSGALSLSNTMNIAGVEKQDALGQMSKFQRMNNGDNGKDLDLMEAYANEIADINQPLSEFVLQLMASGKSAEHIRTTLSLINPIYQKIANEGEKISKENEIQASISKEVNAQKRKLLNAISLQATMANNNLKLLKDEQNYATQRMNHQAKLTESLGFLSEETENNEKIAIEQKKIDNEYLNKKKKANDEAVAAQNKLAADLFAGSKKNTGMNFSILKGDYEKKVLKPSGPGSLSQSNPSTATETIKASENPEEAFQGNLKKLQKQLTDAGMSELSAKLKGVRSAEEANARSLDYLKNLNDSAEKSKQLSKLQEMNVVSSEGLNSKLESINQSKDEQLRVANEEKSMAENNLGQLRKEFQLNKNGVGAARQRVDRYNELKKFLAIQGGMQQEVNKAMLEEVDAVIINGQISKEVNGFKRSYLQNSDYISKLTESLAVTLDEEYTNELEALAKQRARIAAEEKNTKLQELAAQTIQERIRNERSGFGKKMRDSNTETNAKLEVDPDTGKTFFEGKADLNLTEVTNAGKELAAQFAADKTAGVHLQETLNTMAEEGRSWVKSVNDFQQRLNDNDFATKAKQSTITEYGNVVGKSQAREGMLNKITRKDFSGTSSPDTQNELVGLTGFQAKAKTATTDLITETNNLTDQHKANIEFKKYEIEASKKMTEESINFSSSLIEAQSRLDNNDFATKALEQSQTQSLAADGEAQSVLGKRNKVTDPTSDFFGKTGNEIDVDTSTTKLTTETNRLTDVFNQRVKSGYFSIEAEESLKQAKIKAKEAEEQFTAQLKAGQFTFDAHEEMNQAQRDFTKELIKLKEKIANGEGFKDGAREVEMNEETARYKVQKAEGTRDAYSEKGATVKAAEADLAVAQARKEMNLELGKEALFRDTITERIAENNVALERFGETLANTSFDAVENGLNDLVTNMGDSTKSMSDSLKGFAGGIAQSISDAFKQRATKQLTSGIFELFGMGDTGVESKHSGGLIQGFASGGSVGSPDKVPAMLTSGEYVVRKKIVDKLGSKSLESINESGSLNDLYNKSNEDLFDISTEGSSLLPSMEEGDKSSIMQKSLLNQRPMISEEKPSVGSLSDEDSEMIRMNALSDALNKFHGGIVGLFQGGLANLSKTLLPVQKLNRGGMSDHSDWSSFGFNPSAQTGVAMNQKNLKGELTARSSSKPASVESPEPNLFNRSLHEKAANIKSAALNIESENSRAPIEKSRVGDENAKYSHVPANESTAASKFYDQTMSIGSDSPSNIQQSLMNTSSIPATRKSLEKQLESANFEVPGFITGGDTGDKKNWLESTWDKGNKALTSNADDSSMTKIAKGSGTLVGNIVASREKESGQNEDTSPKPPSKPQRLNSSSALDIDSTSTMMSARYKANDSYRKDYAQYLLDKYEYEVQKQNEHVMNNANQLQAIAGNITGAIAAHGLNNEFDNIKKLRADKKDAKNLKSLEDKVESDSSGFKKVEMKPKRESGRADLGLQKANESKTNMSPGSSIAKGSPSSNHTNSYSKSATRLSQPGKNTTINNKYLYTGNQSNNTETPYERTREEKPLGMSAGGRVHGPGGIDKVGPIMLDKGEYVIKASSVKNVEKKYPGFFNRLNSMKMNQGGPVTNTPNTSSNISNATNTSSQSNNISVNVTMPSNNSSGDNSGSINQEALAGKIKEAVTHVISQEQRVGGSLRGK